MRNRNRKEILAELKDRGYELFSKEEKNKKVDEDESSDELEGDNESDADLAKGYESPEHMLRVFYYVWLDFYCKQKAQFIKIMRREIRMLSNKSLFVEEVCSGNLVVRNRKRKEILDELKDHGCELFSK